MRSVFKLLSVAMFVVMAGCVTERVVWSPDGTWAAVIGDDGLHVCDLAGKLSPLLAHGSKLVQWMPDSKRVVVCWQLEQKTWKGVVETFDKEALAATKNMDAVRAEVAAATDGWERFAEDTKKKLRLSNEQFTMVIMALSARNDEALAAKTSKEWREAIAGVSILEDVVEIYTIDNRGAARGATLYRKANASGGVQSLRVSPTGAAVILSVDVSATKEHPEPPQLVIVPTDGSQKNIKLGRAARYPDWSSEGKYVVFITPADWKEGQTETLVGILARQQVADENGRFLDSDSLPKREDLAGLLFNELSRVRVAKDGRIFFSTAEIFLPAAVKDIDTQLSIFSFEPGKQSTLTRVVPRSASQTLGDAAQYFELSPEARYLSIPFGDGRVSVLDIASGEAEVVQSEAEPESKDRLRLTSIPQWRTPTELTFVRPISNSTAHEVVRYSVADKSATVISADWPVSIGNWLAPQESPKDSAATSGAPK